MARSWGDRDTMLMGTGIWSKMPGIQWYWLLWNIVNTLRALDLTFYFFKKLFLRWKCSLDHWSTREIPSGYSF